MWYSLFKALIGPVLVALCRPRVVGVEGVPHDGPVILAANHCSFVDSLLICLVVPRQVTFVAKSEYFDGTGVRGRLRSLFFRVAGQIPVDRRGAEHAEVALNAAKGVLRRGGVWAIHPEGTRTSGAVVHRGRTGAMRVAAETGVCVVPVGIRGSAGVTPPGARIWRPSRVSVVFGRPRPASAYGSECRCATDQLMAEVAVLAGLEYVDDYYRNRSAH